MSIFWTMAIGIGTLGNCLGEQLVLSNVKKNVANILLFLRNANPEYNLRYVSRASKPKFACCFVLAIAGGF